MDYDLLLNLATDLGYGLLECGAEIYRVEESIQRLLHAYGVEQADPFVIPNCIIVSMVTPQGDTLTQVRRMPSHGTDVDLLEQYNDLCRRLCREPLPIPEARQALRQVAQNRRSYPLPILLGAYLLGATFFCLFFGGSVRDAFCSGICGILIGLALAGMTRLHTNLFFQTTLGAALSAFAALTLVSLGIGQHSQLIIIGALMALVPGLMFTNAIRDVMAGDMVAGLSKIADALLTGVAVALGTGFALSVAPSFMGGGSTEAAASFVPVLYAALACASFSVIYNIHGFGIFICACGGALGWFVYLLSAPLLQSEITQSLAAAVTISLYAEVMARVRKCPVTAYLLMAIFPLVPGGGIYYTMEHAINGEIDLFLTSFLHTMGIAGALALGVLLVSSAVRMWATYRHRRTGSPTEVK